MRAVLIGDTGMVGHGVLATLLEDPSVDGVTWPGPLLAGPASARPAFPKGDTNLSVYQAAIAGNGKRVVPGGFGDWIGDGGVSTGIFVYDRTSGATVRANLPATGDTLPGAHRRGRGGSHGASPGGEMHGRRGGRPAQG